MTARTGLQFLLVGSWIAPQRYFIADVLSSTAGTNYLGKQVIRAPGKPPGISYLCINKVQFSQQRSPCGDCSINGAFREASDLAVNSRARARQNR